MTITMNAVFDGEVFRPDEPLDLPPNTKVRLTIETTEPERPEHIRMRGGAATVRTASKEKAG
jgi:predicted DNA-binding antitoxin AbrB/MazE fold protein